MTGKILQSAKDWIPHKEVTVRNSDKPFYNGYLHRLRRKVNRLHTKAKRWNTLISWDVHRLERNFYFREVARCKNEYLTCLYEKIDNEELHQRSFFKLAKSFLSKTADMSTPPLLSPEGILIVSTRSIRWILWFSVRYAAAAAAAARREIFGVNALRGKQQQLGSPNLQDIFIGGKASLGRKIASF